MLLGELARLQTILMIYENNEEYYADLQSKLLQPNNYKPVLERTERVTF